MIVGFARGCGLFEVKPWKDSDEKQLVRTYRAWPETGVIEFLHGFAPPVFADMNWWFDPEDGEAGFYKWGKGMCRNNPCWFPNVHDHFCGREQGWFDGFNTHDDEALEWRYWGNSTCCLADDIDHIRTQYLAFSEFTLECEAIVGVHSRPALHVGFRHAGERTYHLSFRFVVHAIVGVGSSHSPSFGLSLDTVPGDGSLAVTCFALAVAGGVGIGVSEGVPFGVGVPAEVGVGVEGEPGIGVGMVGAVGAGYLAVADFALSVDARVTPPLSPDPCLFGIGSQGVAGVGIAGDEVAFAFDTSSVDGVGAAGGGTAFALAVRGAVGAGAFDPMLFGVWSYGIVGVGGRWDCRFAFWCADLVGVGVVADEVWFAFDCEASVDYDDTPAGPTPDYTGCSACPLGTFHEWTVTFAGGTGDFAAFNGDWPLGVMFMCSWSGGTFPVSIFLQPDFMTGGFQLQFTGGSGSAVYKIASGLWHCTSDNTLTLDSSGGTGSVPGTVTLHGTG